MLFPHPFNFTQIVYFFPPKKHLLGIAHLNPGSECVSSFPQMGICRHSGCLCDLLSTSGLGKTQSRLKSLKSLYDQREEAIQSLKTLGFQLVTGITVTILKCKCLGLRPYTQPMHKTFMF